MNRGYDRSDTGGGRRGALDIPYVADHDLHAIAFELTGARSIPRHHAHREPARGEEANDPSPEGAGPSSYEDAG